MNTDTPNPPESEMPPPTRRRRWWQYSLRTLLLLVALSAVLFAVVGVRFYRDLQQRRAVEAILAAGGQVVRDDEGHVVRVYLSGQDFDDLRLRRLVWHLRNLPRLHELDLVDCPISDAGLADLRRIHQLRLLYVHQTHVTEGGLDRLHLAFPDLVVKREKPDPIASRLTARNIYPHAIVTLAWSADGSTLYSGGGDGALRVWDVQTGQERATVAAHSAWLFSLVLSADGTRLATGGGDQLIRLWDTASLAPLGVLWGHDDDVHALAFIADPRPSGTLVSAGDDCTVRVWDVATGRERFVLEGHSAAVTALRIGPDGRTVASASRDGQVCLWDVASGDLLRVLAGHTADVMSVSFSPDGQSVATASYDRSVRLWDTASGQPLAELGGYDDWVFAVAHSPDGTLLATGAADGLRLWNVPGLQQRHRWSEPADVACVAFSADGRTLAASSADGTIRLYDPHSGQSQRTLYARYGERGLASLATATP